MRGYPSVRVLLDTTDDCQTILVLADGKPVGRYCVVEDGANERRGFESMIRKCIHSALLAVMRRWGMP